MGESWFYSTVLKSHLNARTISLLFRCSVPLHISLHLRPWSCGLCIPWDHQITLQENIASSIRGRGVSCDPLWAPWRKGKTKIQYGWICPAYQSLLISTAAGRLIDVNHFMCHCSYEHLQIYDDETVKWFGVKQKAEELFLLNTTVSFFAFFFESSTNGL